MKLIEQLKLLEVLKLDYSLIDVKTGEVIKDIKSVIQGNGNTTEPMSIWEIQQYNKLYGWTPPSGFTRKQIDDYVPT